MQTLLSLLTRINKVCCSAINQKKTKLAQQAEEEIREIVKLGQNFVLMKLE